MAPYTPRNLCSPPTPIGLHPEFCVDHPIGLILDKKFWQWTGGDFKVYDVTGQLRLQSEGKTSWVDKQYLQDPQGRPIFQSQTKHLSWTAAADVRNPNGEIVLKLKKEPMTWTTDISATFTDVFTGQERVIHLLPKVMKEEAKIMLDGQLVGYVEKESFWSENRRLQIARNVDYALLVQIVLYYDSRVEAARRRRRH